MFQDWIANVGTNISKHVVKTMISITRHVFSIKYMHSSDLEKKRTEGLHRVETWLWVSGLPIVIRYDSYSHYYKFTVKGVILSQISSSGRLIYRKATVIIFNTFYDYNLTLVDCYDVSYFQLISEKEAWQKNDKNLKNDEKSNNGRQNKT